MSRIPRRGYLTPTEVYHLLPYDFTVTEVMFNLAKHCSCRGVELARLSIRMIEAMEIRGWLSLISCASWKKRLSSNIPACETEWLLLSLPDNYTFSVKQFMAWAGLQASEAQKDLLRLIKAGYIYQTEGDFRMTQAGSLRSKSLEEQGYEKKRVGFASNNK